MDSTGSVPLLSWRGLIFFAFLIAFAAFILVVSPILARRRLERWAAARQLHLIEFNTTPFWRGPRAWRRNRYQWDYRILVEDSSGRRREGWLLENWPFLNLGHPDYEVRWDDDSLLRPSVGS
jgi:hypothetical protein